MVGINEELKATEAARAVLSTTNPNSKATIRVLRQAKYVAALAMTTFASDKPLNDAAVYLGSAPRSPVSSNPANPTLVLYSSFILRA
jgi:hypothetical protein